MKVSEYNRIISVVDEMVEGFKSHKFKTYRIVTKVWKATLLRNMDKFQIEGYPVELKGKNIGAGVYEISIIEQALKEKP